VVRHGREKVSCRCGEAISEAPAPFHPIACGRAGPELLAEVIFGKDGLHLPLNRQSVRFARGGGRADRRLDAGRPGRRGGGIVAAADRHEAARSLRRYGRARSRAALHRRSYMSTRDVAHVGGASLALPPFWHLCP
jgi:transposase